MSTEPTTTTEPDEGAWRLATRVLAAATRGDHDEVGDLLAPLDADQLRSLVGALAVRVDTTAHAASMSDATAVCEYAMQAAAATFETTPEEMRGSERSRNVSDARAVAMSVARRADLSLREIAEHFDKDHNSVVHAIRRAGERPRLESAAAQIHHQLQQRFTAAAPEHAPAPVDAPALAPVSSFQPSDLVEAAVVATAREFGTTAETLLGPERTRAAADARAVAMAAARLRGESLPAIARHFDRDHTAVLHATRRIQATPPLFELAEKIATHITDPTPAPAPEPARARPPEPPFEPTDLVETAVAAASREFGTTPQTLLGPERTRAAADARAVAMAAARLRGESLPAIARHFDRDHTTVLSATRRIQATPPLLKLAKAIADDLPEPAPDAVDPRQSWELPTAVSSHGAAMARRAAPAGTERPQLRIAR